MAVERFPVEAGHILMFARSIGDENPIYTDAEAAKKHRGRRHHRPADLRAGLRPVRPRLLPAPEARPALVRLGQEPDRHQPRRRAAAAGAAAAAACTPSSTTSTTAPCGPATCSRPRPSRARPGRRRASAPASWCSPRASPSTATRTASSSSPPAASACAPRRPVES